VQAFFKYLTVIHLVLFGLAAAAFGQAVERKLPFASGGSVEIINRYGRVDVKALPPVELEDGTAAPVNELTMTARSASAILEKDISIEPGKSRIKIEVKPADASKRIDLVVQLPERSNINIETGDGAVMVDGDLRRITALTETGTVAVNVPTDALKYDLQWTESRPRFLSDIELEKVKERSAGRFTIHGSTVKKNGSEPSETPEPDPAPSPPAPEAKKAKNRDRGGVELDLTTARGIILLNVPPSEVSSDLRERPLTNAAKAIIRSGDTMLMDAIRRASPKYFGDYAATLPPVKREPVFGVRGTSESVPAGTLKRITVSAIDISNRTVSDLSPDDFEVTEIGQPREIVSVQPVTAPFNLVLLVDVSGSVENYLSFIRKAARAFVNTVGRNDRVAIVTFNEDVHVLSGFTTDKPKLSASLDTFDAGGGTAYYDALAFTLADTLRPIKGERTAIVVLTDGDDNRSFLSFDSLLGSLQESGALVYPLYVPSNLIASSASTDPNASADPLRTRYMGLTTKAEGEGARLAEVSGGRYYPITQLSQIQAAYDDIVRQLRTAYTITYRSNTADVPGTGVSPRIKVRVKRENVFVKLGTISVVEK
jgi:VWFA-related protein